MTEIEPSCTKLTQVDKNWTKLTQVFINWTKLTQVDTSCHKLIQVDSSWHKFNQVDINLTKLTQTDPSWHKTNQVDPCRHKFTKLTQGDERSVLIQNFALFLHEFMKNQCLCTISLISSLALSFCAQSHYMWSIIPVAWEWLYSACKNEILRWGLEVK